MDWFGRKAAAENAQLRFQLRKTMIKLVNKRAAVRHLQHKIEVLDERMRLKEDQIGVLREDVRRLTEPPLRPSTYPLYVGEHEEDIIHAREAQAISLAEAEDMLRELDFENTEIILDEPDSDLTLY